MKTSQLFILFLLFFTASCSNPGKKDYSHPVDHYVQLGIPDIDRPWKVSECPYKDFSLALLRLSSQRSRRFILATYNKSRS